MRSHEPLTALWSTPVTRYEVESIVEKYIKKVRADLQPLKKFAKESAENG